MSKVPNATPSCLSNPTVFWENPHFGWSGLPFMNSITLLEFMIFLHLSNSCSSDSFSGGWWRECVSMDPSTAPVYVEGAACGAEEVEDEGPPLVAEEEDEDAWEATADASAEAFAPDTLDKSVWPRRRTKVGTESTSKDSDTSGCDSASTWAVGRQELRCQWTDARIEISSTTLTLRKVSAGYFAANSLTTSFIC